MNILILSVEKNDSFIVDTLFFYGYYRFTPLSMMIDQNIILHTNCDLVIV